MNATLFDTDADAERKRYCIAHLGDPMPMPRPEFTVVKPRAGGEFVNTYTPKVAVDRQSEIEVQWRREVGLKWVDGSVPLVLFCVFAFARPSGHFGTGRNATTVKPQHLARRPGGLGNKNSAGQRTGGDLDNCVKLVADALNDVAYADDGQLVRIEAEKLFVDQAGVAEPQSIIELGAL